MNCTFTLAHGNLVVEAAWFGKLTYEIIVDGLISQNQWIIKNSDKFPLALVSDYTNANLNNITEADLQGISDQFQGEGELFPDMAWIAVMPGDVKYEIVRLWLEHADSWCRDSHVVKDRAKAENIVSEILGRYQE